MLKHFYGERGLYISHNEHFNIRTNRLTINYKKEISSTTTNIEMPPYFYLVINSFYYFCKLFCSKRCYYFLLPSSCVSENCNVEMF